MDKVYRYKKLVHSSDMSEREKTLKMLWTNFTKYGIEQSGTRSIILSSWKRSQNAGLDPSKIRAPICDIHTLKKKQQENKEILGLIRPFMDDLFEMVKGTDSIIAFADKTGVVLDLCGDSEIALNAASVNFTVGVNMAEHVIGTNSIGTAIATGKAIQVIGAEHFCVSWHTSHCSSAPIIDPRTNEIIGVITLIGYVRSANSHALGLVKTASNIITKLMEKQGISKEKVMIDSYFHAVIESISDGIVISNPFGEIVRANELAIHFLKLPEGNSENMNLHDVDFLQPVLNLWENTNDDKKIRMQNEIHIPYDDKYTLGISSRKIFADHKSIGYILILRKNKKKERRELSGARYTFSSLVGEDPAFLKAVKLATKAAQTDKSVLMIGESGTGKELFAQAIHNESSRQAESFLAINCAAIPKELIASELFGYVDGAFTNAVKGGRKGKFEAANGGTVFLDEIGDMPLDLQAYLLRVLEEKEVTPIGSTHSRPVDVRIIAATNKDLYQLVQEKKFRLDLYYRLNVISLNIPSLRKRRQDIPLFVNHYLPSKKISPDVMKAFYEYEWPGNLREMKNVMEQIEIYCDTDIVTEDDLPDYLVQQIEETIGKEASSLYQSAANYTKKETMIIAIKNSKNLSEAAKTLGISVSTIYRWASEYQLNLKELRQH